MPRRLARSAMVLRALGWLVIQLPNTGEEFPRSSLLIMEAKTGPWAITGVARKESPRVTGPLPLCVLPRAIHDNRVTASPFISASDVEEWCGPPTSDVSHRKRTANDCFR